MSSDGQTQSQLNKECEEMVLGSTIHLNPKLANLRRTVLLQIQKYSLWYPEKCTTTKDGFLCLSPSQLLLLEKLSKFKVANFVNELKMIPCGIWFCHLSK